MRSYVWSLSAGAVGTDRHVPCFGLDDVVVFPFSVGVVCVLDVFIVCRGRRFYVATIISLCFSSLIVVCCYDVEWIWMIVQWIRRNVQWMKWKNKLLILLSVTSWNVMLRMDVARRSKKECQEQLVGRVGRSMYLSLIHI